MFSELAAAISTPRSRLIETTDLDQWDAFTRKTLQAPYKFEIARGHRLDAELYHIDCGSFSLGRRRNGAEVFAQSAPTLSGGYGIVLPFDGACESELGPNSISLSPALGSVTSLRHPTSNHASEHFDHAILVVSQTELERTCAALLGRDLDRPLDFEVRFPTSGPAFERLLHAMTLAASVSNLPVRHPLLVANLEQLVMGTLLLAQPNTYSDLLADPQARLPPAAVRRALDYMEANLDEPLTMMEVAGYAGVGLRSLQIAFRDHFGISPGRWLRDRRLDRVHAALSQATPSSTTVTRVAFDWGFGHLGEFASVYRRRFGVSPSVTLAKR